jgi:hypothetical protein
MKDAISYVRVSSEEQADSGLSLEAQRQRIAAYCAMKGPHLAEVFEDPGISAGKPLASRPAGSKLLAAAKKGRAVVVVAKLDRLFRSVADAASVIDDFEKRGIQLVAIAESFDMTSPYDSHGANGLGFRRVGTRDDPGTDAHFAVALAQAGQRRLDALAHFHSLQPGAGTAAARGQAIGQLLGRFVGERQPRVFPPHAALAGADVPAVQVDDPLPRQPSQPGIEGQGAVPRVIGQLSGGLGQGLLQHVRRIDARPHAAIETQGDHLPQAAAVALQEQALGGGIAASETLQQLVGVRRFHGASQPLPLVLLKPL